MTGDKREICIDVVKILVPGVVVLGVTGFIDLGFPVGSIVYVFRPI